MENDMQVLATRTLHDVATGAELVVSMAAPEELPDGVWQCRFSIAENGAPLVESRGMGSDAFQALALALEGIRVNLRDRQPRLSWMGFWPGVTGFHRVNYAFGPQIVDELEAHIDRRLEEYSAECAAGLHGPPPWA